MILSFWRRAHLLLALTASIFLIITSATGVILSFSPITNELNQFNIRQAPNATVAELVQNLQNEYEEIIEVKVTPERFLEVSVITFYGDFENFYAHPKTGKKIGEIQEENAIFSFTRALHRSLFLGDVGRCLIGLTAFLLVLIALSGTILVIKRQLRFRRFFARIVSDDSTVYWHVLLGRTTLFLIVLISLTGTYLSLYRFGFIPEASISKDLLLSTKTKHNERLPTANFPSFKSTFVSEIESIQFPFSPDPEDYFVLKFPNEEQIIDQFTGKIVRKEQLGAGAKLAQLSFNIHTGKGSILWSIVLAIASLSILFFIYSGFKITLLRLKGKPRNKHSINQSSIILLVGSEGGNSLRLARKFQQLLVESGQHVFVDELNNYQIYQQIKHLIIFTSTYGQGEPPTNAKKFLEKQAKYKQRHPFTFAVVGFGSTDYPHYCRFAEHVHAAMQKTGSNAKLLPLFKINKGSIDALNEWIKLWSTATQTPLRQPLISVSEGVNYAEFEVLTATPSVQRANDTFLLKIKATNDRIQSGDLFVIPHAKKGEERFYSIGVIDPQHFQLCIRKHPDGYCSSLLSNLEEGMKIKGRIQPNPSFNLLQKEVQIIGISNGTGIAPLLGFGYELAPTNNFQLYWGGKSNEVLAIFEQQIKELQSSGKLARFSVAFSADQSQESSYVQSLIKEDASKISTALKENAVIYICGSIKMRSDVLKTLDTIVRVYNNLSIEYYERRGQIKIDCY